MKMTSNFLLRKVLFLSAIFFLTLVFSCKKDGKLTPDFENGNLSINFTDTFSVVTTIEREDSLRTDASNVHLLGLYNDPIFGLSSSSIYTQVLLTGTSVDFGTAPVLDSVVLSLDYQGFNGDGYAMEVEVHKLNSVLYADTNYYSTTTVMRESAILGSTIFSPNLSSDLRITLDTSLGNAILNNAPYADNAAFESVLKGLYITTKDSVNSIATGKQRGSIAYFDLTSGNSVVTLYYHHDIGPKNSSEYNFSINSEAEKFSHFEHNYTGTDIEAHLNDLPTKDSTVTYVSTMAGIKTKVEIPNLKDLIQDGAVTINKAEMIFTIENGTESDINNALPTVSLIRLDENGDELFLIDILEGIDHFGGSLVDNGSSKTYTFNISRHLHELLYDTPINNAMYLVSTGRTSTSIRSVISSENSPTFKIKLEITYSKL